MQNVADGLGLFQLGGMRLRPAAASGCGTRTRRGIGAWPFSESRHPASLSQGHASAGDALSSENGAIASPLCQAKTEGEMVERERQRSCAQSWLRQRRRSVIEYSGKPRAADERDEMPPRTCGGSGAERNERKRIRGILAEPNLRHETIRIGKPLAVSVEERNISDDRGALRQDRRTPCRSFGRLAQDERCRRPQPCGLQKAGSQEREMRPSFTPCLDIFH